MKISLTNTYSVSLDIYDLQEEDHKISSGIQRMSQGNAMEDVIALKKIFTVKTICDGDLKDFLSDSLILTIDDKKYNVIISGNITKAKLVDGSFDLTLKLEEV